MKFKIHVKGAESGEDWWEEYTYNTDDPENWALELIDNFNSSLQPGEEQRSYLGFEILDEEATLHDWVKNAGGMSVNFRGRICDFMYCKACGITGKKYGLSSVTIIDSKFKKKAFIKCNTSKEEFLKIRVIGGRDGG